MKNRVLFWALILLALSLAACTGKQSQTPAAGTGVPTAVESTPLAGNTLSPIPSGGGGSPEVTPTATPVPATATAALQPGSASPTPTPGEVATASPAPPTAQPATPTAAATQGTPAASPTVPAVTPTGTAAAGGEGASNCADVASFFGDVTIPDNTSLRQGEAFVKTWRIRNSGTCTWGPGYTLIFASGNIMSGNQENPLPEVPPGTTTDISVNLVAPARGGTYTGNWEFQNPSGQRFGVNSGGSDLIWVTINVSFVTPGGAPQPTPSTSSCGAQRNTDYENQVLTLINNARTSQGLKPLELQDQLSAAALAHSMDMACNNFVDHVGSDGSTWFDRVKAQGYANFTSARENIYVGNPDFGGTPQGAFDWWMNSQVHRDNILYPNVSQIGIAYVFDANSDYGGYYTTVFARP